MKMQVLKNILLFILIFGFILFGILYPSLYSDETSIHFIISFFSVILLFTTITLDKFFEKNIFCLNFYELLIAGYWKNIYLIAVYIFLPLLMSIPFLISKNFNNFLIVFSSCYFQAIVIVSLFKLFFNLLKKETWYIITMVILLSLVLSNNFTFGQYFLFNPLLGITFSPYYFDFTFTVWNVVLSALITYSIVGLMYVTKDLIKRK